MTDRASKTKRLEFINYLYEELGKFEPGQEEEAAALVDLIDREERVIGPPPPIGKLLEDIHLKPWSNKPPDDLSELETDG